MAAVAVTFWAPPSGFIFQSSQLQFCAHHPSPALHVPVVLVLKVFCFWMNIATGRVASERETGRACSTHCLIERYTKKKLVVKPYGKRPFGILGYYLRIILKIWDRSLAVLTVLTFTLCVLF